MAIFETMDDKCDYWSSLLNYIVDEHIPLKKKKFRSVDVFYMTKRWKIAIRAKRKAAKQYALNKTQENWEIKKKNRNEATKERRKAIKAYWKKTTDKMNTNPKDFFKAFRTFMGTKKHFINGDQINIKSKNNTVITNQNAVADELSKYFSTLADDIGGTNVFIII